MKPHLYAASKWKLLAQDRRVLGSQLITVRQAGKSVNKIRIFYAILCLSGVFAVLFFKAATQNLECGKGEINRLEQQKYLTGG